MTLLDLLGKNDNAAYLNTNGRYTLLMENVCHRGRIDSNKKAHNRAPKAYRQGFINNLLLYRDLPLDRPFPKSGQSSAVVQTGTES